jgi:signal transduction histidine kinase
VVVDRQFEDLPEQAPLPIKIALLRTLQEALSNATRHGRGANVAAKLRSESNSLVLTVSDSGPGFDPSAVASNGHLGIAGMRERAELLSGAFDVRSAPGSGTCVTVSWPLAAQGLA